mmetsp:Transcript_61574/g.163791  ORF Transcript_61574/g.163791 Transcript_61574/m.163791 type:complete len:295 (+) Transcript_61574:506-1390(+)
MVRCMATSKRIRWWTRCHPTRPFAERNIRDACQIRCRTIFHAIDLKSQLLVHLAALDLFERDRGQKKFVEILLGETLAFTRRVVPRRKHLFLQQPLQTFEVFLRENDGLPMRRHHLAQVMLGIRKKTTVVFLVDDHETVKTQSHVHERVLITLHGEVTSKDVRRILQPTLHLQEVQQPRFLRGLVQVHVLRSTYPHEGPLLQSAPAAAGVRLSVARLRGVPMNGVGSDDHEVTCTTSIHGYGRDGAELHVSTHLRDTVKIHPNVEIVSRVAMFHTHGLTCCHNAAVVQVIRIWM